MRASACCSRAVCRRSEQQLHGAQVAGSPIDQRGLGPAQRVRSELEGIEPDASNPLTDQACVLSSGQAAINSAPAGKQELAVAPACNPKMLVDCLPCLLGQLEPDGPSGLLLSNRRPVQGVAVGGDIVDADGHHIATTQLAVDCEIEQSQVAGAPLQLQPSELTRRAPGGAGAWPRSVFPCSKARRETCRSRLRHCRSWSVSVSIR